MRRRRISREEAAVRRDWLKIVMFSRALHCRSGVALEESCTSAALVGGKVTIAAEMSVERVIREGFAKIEAEAAAGPRPHWRPTSREVTEANRHFLGWD